VGQPEVEAGSNGAIHAEDNINNALKSMVNKYYSGIARFCRQWWQGSMAHHNDAAPAITEMAGAAVGQGAPVAGVPAAAA
jgi:hypothetical protein